MCHRNQFQRKICKNAFCRYIFQSVISSEYSNLSLVSYHAPRDQPSNFHHIKRMSQLIYLQNIKVDLLGHHYKNETYTFSYITYMEMKDIQAFCQKSIGKKRKRNNYLKNTNRA